MSFAGTAQANPQGGTVAGGSATIQQTSPSRVDIIQSSDRAVIDWRGFSIKSGEHTNFQQPNAGSVTLNRVSGPEASRIDGTLSATGNVFLVNPNGVMIGPGARVDVGGLVATTTDIRNDNFMAARDRFDMPSTRPGAKVSNAGSITVKQGGLAALVAPEVENSGVIQARLGRVAIAGAERFAVDLNGDGLLSFEVGAAPAGAKVSHSGTIKADGGTVLLSAEAAKGVVDNVVNVTGVIEAKAVSAKGGTIVLSGGGGGVSVAGTLDASAAGADQAGGTVKLLGDKVAVEGTAQLDASGPGGGGSVLVGGNWQGQGPERNASRASVAAGASIAADSVSGQAGTVVVWSDGRTRMDGRISARRGKVETSGKETLAIGKTAKVEAAEWLLDPRNVTIAGTTANGAFDGGSPTNTFTPSDNDATVDAATIVSSLNGGANVTVTTSGSGNQQGNITVASALSWTTGNTLTLNADRDVAVNAAVSASSASSGFSVIAGRNVSQSAAITVAGATAINAGGDITLTNTGNAFGTLALSAAASNSSASIVSAGALDLGTSTVGGALSLTAGGSITQSGALIIGGTTTLALTTAGSDIRLDAQANTFGSIAFGGTAANIRDFGIRNVSSSAAVPTLSGLANLNNLFLTFDNSNVVLPALTAAGNATIVAGDSITQSGALSIAGTTTLTAPSNRNMTLDTPSNVFGTVSVTQGQNLSITNNAALDFGAVSISGAFNVTAEGDVTQTGAISVGGNSGIAVNGMARSILLGNTGNNFTGTVAFVGDGLTNVTIADSSALVIPTLTLTGDLSATGLGGLTQGGVLDIGGTLTVGSGATTDILLDTAGNRIRTLAFNGGRNATIVSADPVVLAGGVLGGALMLTAGGAITQSAGVAIGDLATLDAGTSAITLTDGGNDFASLALTGSDVQITDSNSVTLAASTVTGNLQVVAGDSVDQSGILSVTGTSSFAANGNGASIALANAGNQFGGAVTVSGSAGNAAVTLANSTDLDMIASSLGSLSVSAGGDISVQATGALTLSGLSTGGTATVAATGAIGDSGALNVTGLASFTTLSSGVAGITLDNAGSSFGSLSVRARNAGDTANAAGAITVAVDGSLVLADLQTTGAASLTIGNSAPASASLTQTNALSAGTLTLAGGATTSDFDLADASNSFTGLAFGGTLSRIRDLELRNGSAFALPALSGLTLRDLNLRFDSGNLVLPTVTVGRDLTLFAGGAISQTGAALVNNGTATVTAGGTVTLTSGNRFSSLQLDASSATVNDTGALSFAGASIDNGLSVTAVSIGQTGAISVGGTATATATGNGTSIALGNNGNQLSGAVTVSSTLGNAAVTLGNSTGLNVTAGSSLGSLSVSAGGDITVDATGALTLIGLSTGSNATVTTTGAISDSGALNVGGLASFTTLAFGSAPITLNNAGSSFGSLSVRARNTNNTGNAFGPITVAVDGSLALANLQTADAASITIGNAAPASASLTHTGALAAGSLTLTGGATSSDFRLASAANSFGGLAFGGTLSRIRDLELRNAAAFALPSLSGLSGLRDLNLRFDSGNLELPTVTVGRNLTLFAGGAISQAGAAIVNNGTATVTAGSTATLTAANRFNSLQLSANSATVNDTGALSFAGASITNGLTLTAGSIGQTGAISVGGTTTATTTGAITLTNTGNSVASFGTGGATDVSLFTTGGLSIQNLTASGNVSLTAGNAIDDVGSLFVGSGLSLITRNNSGAAITLNNIFNSYGDLTLRATRTDGSAAAGNITVSRFGAVSIGQLETTGNVTLSALGPIDVQATGSVNFAGLSTSSSAMVSATGAITDSGLISVSGAASFTTLSNAGAAIALDFGTNAYGTVTARARNAANSANANGNITLVTNGNLALAQLDTTANATLAAAGAITDTGTLTVGGTLNATTLNNAGAAIALDNAANSFGSASARARNAANTGNANGAITLVADGALNLAQIDTASTATVTATGAITDSGPLTVAGLFSATTLNDAGAAITLNSAGNSLSEVSLRARNASDSAASTGAITLRSVGPVNLTRFDTAGDASITTGGNVTQTGAATVGGTLALDVGATNDVALTRSDNDFGTVSVAAARDVSLTDATGIILGTSMISGNLTVLAGGAIGQSGVLSVAGLTTLSAAGTDIILDDAGNDFASLLLLAGDDATLTDDNDVEFAGATLSGRLTVDADGTVTQTGAITAAELAAIAGDAIVLTNPLNQVAAAQGLSGAGVALATTGPLSVIGPVTATGSGNTITLSATGTLSLTGAVDAGNAGTVSLGGSSIAQSGSGVITAQTLTDTQTGVAGTVDLALGNRIAQIGAFTAGGNFTLRSLDPLQLTGALASGGTATLTSGGGLSQTVAGTLTATSLRLTATGAVDLSVAGNSIGQLLGATGTRVALNDVAGGLTVGGAVTGSTGPVSLVTAGGSLQTGAAITGNGVTLRGVGLDLLGGTAVDAGAGLLTLDAGTGSAFLAIGTSVRTTGLAAITAGGAVGFDGDVTVGNRLDVSAGGNALFLGNNLIAGIGTFSAGGRIELFDGATNLTISGAMTAGNAFDLRMTKPGGGFAVTASGSLAAGAAQDMTLVADRMGFAGAVSGQGMLYLQPLTQTRSMAIGHSAAGDLSISADSVDKLAEGFSQIELGGDDYAGVIELGSATFKDALTVRAARPGAAIHVVGLLQVGGTSGPTDVLLIGPGASTTLTGTIVTAGGTIEIQDRVYVGGSALLDTTGGGGMAGGASIILNGQVDGTTAYGQQLTLNAGSSGDLSFLGALGMATPLGTVLVTNANSFTANQAFVAGVLDVSVGTGTINASQVDIRDSMIVRGTGGTANILGSVQGLSGEFAAHLVQRPDGPASTYIINGCIMGTLCGVDPNFFVNFELMRVRPVTVDFSGVDAGDNSLFAIQRTTDLPRTTELIGPRDQEPGSIAPAAGGSSSGFGAGMRSANLPAPVDPSTIQYSSVGDWELW